MEKINDIVREVAAEMLNTSMQEITAERIHGWATRLGATCKESLQVGYAAKMREALMMISCIDTRRLKRLLCELVEADIPGGGQINNIISVVDKAKAALSAPARNCDKCLTPKDAMLAHLEEVYEGEKVEFGDYEWCEFVKWLFAEAKGK